MPQLATVRRLFLSPGKALTDPVFLLLTLVIILLTIVCRRAKRDRLLLGLSIGALVLLWLLSTMAVANLLERSLRIDASDDDPDVIVVTGGGSLHAENPELDILNASTDSRIVAAVAWWHQHPRARLILSGADVEPNGLSVRTLLLMRDYAIRHGVPPSTITLEARSTNTREHPLRIRELPGITRRTRIGLVTSSWHLRRARREFERSFDTVLPRPAWVAAQPETVVNDFLPSAIGLRESTRMLQEWIGIAWYALSR